MKDDNIRNENMQRDVTTNIFNTFFIEKLYNDKHIKYNFKVNFFRAFWLGLLIIFFIYLLSPQRIHTYTCGAHTKHACFTHGYEKNI